jgi:hypothetical protein
MSGLTDLQNGVYGTLKGGVVALVLWLALMAGIAVIGELAFGGGIAGLKAILF